MSKIGVLDPPKIEEKRSRVLKEFKSGERPYAENSMTDSAAINSSTVKQLFKRRLKAESHQLTKQVSHRGKESLDIGRLGHAESVIIKLNKDIKIRSRE